MRARFIRRRLLAAGLLATAGCAAPAEPRLSLEPAAESGYAVLAAPVSEPGVTITTLAGAPGRNGRVDKPGAEARFNHPRGLAYDPVAGELLVADTANHAIRAVSPDGAVTTVAGTGKRGGYYDVLSNTAARRAAFVLPYSLATNGDGTLYVTDTGRHQLQRLTSGLVNTQTGLWALVGRRQTPLYPSLAAVAVDRQGTIYFLQGHALFRIRNGAISTVAGVYSPAGMLFETFVSLYELLRPRPGLVDGPGATATFALPQALVVDGQDNLYIADTFNHAIRKVTFSNGAATVSTVAGALGTASSGSATLTTGQRGYVDGASDSARFAFPCGLALDAAGHLYVADRGNHAIRKVAALTRRVTTLAGGSGLPGQLDGPGTTAGFKQPTGVAVDDAGTIYVTDTGNHTIRKIIP